MTQKAEAPIVEAQVIVAAELQPPPKHEVDLLLTYEGRKRFFAEIAANRKVPVGQRIFAAQALSRICGDEQTVKAQAVTNSDVRSADRAVKQAC